MTSSCFIQHNLYHGKLEKYKTCFFHNKSYRKQRWLRGNLLIKKDLRDIKKITIYTLYFWYKLKKKNVLYKVNVKIYYIFALVKIFKFLGMIIVLGLCFIKDSLSVTMLTDILRDESSWCLWLPSHQSIGRDVGRVRVHWNQTGHVLQMIDADCQVYWVPHIILCCCMCLRDLL